MRTILWKEWRENRWKYASLWLVFNAPMLIVTLMIGVSRAMRVPFADLSDQTAMKYLPLSLAESLLVASIFLLATGFVAVAAFRPKAGEFFVFEQPVSRKRYVAAKLVNGGGHVVAAVWGAILLAPAWVYGLMLMTGKVTVAGSGAAFGAIFGAAARAVVWCSLVSLVAFTGAALISAVTPRWWIAAVCTIVFIAILVRFVHGDSPLVGGGSFFEFFPDIEGKTFSVSANVGTGTDPWLKVSDVLPMPTTFAHLRWLPVVTAAGVMALLSTGVAAVYARQEMK